MKRILLVDDDPNLADSAKDILVDAGYAVEIAPTLKEARSILLSQGIDILVVDFNLPDGKGPMLAREAKTHYPALALILMTGETFTSVDLDEKLFDSILAKPVDPAAFLMLLARFSDPT